MELRLFALPALLSLVIVAAPGESRAEDAVTRWMEQALDTTRSERLGAAGRVGAPSASEASFSSSASGSANARSRSTCAGLMTLEINEARPHQGIDQQIPKHVGSGIGANTEARVIARPILAGLHHDYRRAA